MRISKNFILTIKEQYILFQLFSLEGKGKLRERLPTPTGPNQNPGSANVGPYQIFYVDSKSTGEGWKGASIRFECSG